MKSKLLVIMIDGISSDYFQNYSQFMPNINRLANTAKVFMRLLPECCGSSLPGRASMLTGLTSYQHGIYGNHIWDKGIYNFRYATPYDLRTPTIFNLAKSAGIQTSSIGFGMVQPEDCHIYEPPFWVSSFVGRSRDHERIELTQGWKDGLQIIDDGRLEQAKTKLNSNIRRHKANHLTGLLDEQYQDTKMIMLLNELLSSDESPELIFSEINITDSAQHKFGYASDAAHLFIHYADSLVGNVIQTLRAAGKTDEYTIIITSDHGHENTQGAIYADNIITKNKWSGEGGILLLENKHDNESTLQTLNTLGVNELNNNFLPTDIQSEIICFTSNDHLSFESSRQNTSELTGISSYKSSHSYSPGNPGDERFAVISGPQIKAGMHEGTTPEQLFNEFLEVLAL